MEVLFEEWSCSGINNNEKAAIQEDIKQIFISHKTDMKHTPKTLKISLFEKPNSQLITGSAVDEKGAELATFHRPKFTGNHHYDFNR